jgi:SAM-dependent methyltransferase
VAEAYAETFAPLCAGAAGPVLDAGRVAAGLRVLDVGAGTGELAALAADRGATVTAVDPDPGMRAIAARRAPAARLLGAGLPDLPFADGGYDAVLASFVVNHLPDPRSGVRELARVAAPGGRVVATIWPSGQNVQSLLWAAVLDACDVTPPAGTRLPPELDFPRTAEGLSSLLEEARLGDVRAGPLRWVHETAPDALWRGAAAGVGGIGATVTAQPAAVREALRAAYDRLVRPLVRDGRLCLETEAVLAVGTRR